LSHMLRRYTSLNHLSTAACAVLKNQQQVSQMITDLNKVDFKNVQEQASWVCECDDEIVRRVESSFKTFLQDPNPQEKWAGWCEKVLHICLPDDTTAKQFFFKWEFYSSLVMRDLTLRSAASFGSFHLIRLLYDEYIFYLIEQRIAKSTRTTPLQMLGEASPATWRRLQTRPTPPWITPRPWAKLCIDKLWQARVHYYHSFIPHYYNSAFPSRLFPFDAFLLCRPTVECSSLHFKSFHLPRCYHPSCFWVSRETSQHDKQFNFLPDNTSILTLSTQFAYLHSIIYIYLLIIIEMKLFSFWQSNYVKPTLFLFICIFANFHFLIYAPFCYKYQPQKQLSIIQFSIKVLNSISPMHCVKSHLTRPSRSTHILIDNIKVE